MIKNYNFNKKIIAFLLAGTTTLSLQGCSKKNNKETKSDKSLYSIELEEDAAYELKQNEDIPYLYDVIKYDVEKSKGKIYEMKAIKKSYNVKCTPIEFKKYTNNQNITWEDLKTTINKSKFNNHDKNILLEGVNNLEKNNFNIDLSVINYNIKNISIEYKKEFEDDVLGEFDCFNHKMYLSENIKNEKKYKVVLLHEMLGHGMTDAYIDELKVYCSIDVPTYAMDTNNNYGGYELYGNAFTEAMAQYIAILGLDQELDKEYVCTYDLNIVELLMLCKDNNCTPVEYANNGVKLLTNKMKKNILNPHELISIISRNLESVEIGENTLVESETLMLNYFTERIDNMYKEGKNIEEVNLIISELFNYSLQYVMTLKENSCDIIGVESDQVNFTRLYSSIGMYACETTQENIKKYKKI